MRVFFVHVVSLLLLVATPQAQAFSKLPKFVKVHEGLYRGGRPSEQGLQKLAQMGVKTIINIENDPKAVKKEKKWVIDDGMKFYSIPMGYKSAPPANDVQEILNLMANENLYPIYLHCKHGEDRTGLMIALHRVEYQNWSAQDAYDEMLELGFHTKLKALDQYFKDQTDY